MLSRLLFAAAVAVLFSTLPAGAAEPVIAQSTGVAPAATSGPAASPADLARGKRLFLQCRACHELKAADPHKVGPNLHGIFGTRAASAPGFQFSEALRKSGITWTEQSMDAWLVRPTDVVPGTIMAYAGLPNAADRRALIAYLAAETR